MLADFSKFKSKLILSLLASSPLIACSGNQFNQAQIGKDQNYTVQSQQQNQHEKQFKLWLDGVKPEAIAKGIRPATVNNAFANISYREDVIELDQKQPHATRTFDQYLNSVLPDSRIQKARRLYQENIDLLKSVSQRYGVQPQYIVALWGVESNFGENMGSFPVIESLATLAYEGRRREFFKDELFNALKIIDQGHVDFDNMKGSWAGAMGQTQFMPSSFFNFAADYNNDGRRDIWGTKEDAFASIANYLSKSNWNGQQTWGREVKLPASFNLSLEGLKTNNSVHDWKNMGIITADGQPLPGNGQTKAWIVIPDKEKSLQNKAYIVYNNYQTIMKWNRSTYFATSVGLLADSIVN